MHHLPSAAAGNQQRNALRAAGLAIAAGTIFSTIAVALDGPASGDSPRAFLMSMIAIGGTKAAVHLVAMAAVLAYAFGFTTLARKLDLQRPLVLAGLSAYLFGCMAMLGATLIDGFISSDVAAAFANAPSPESIKQGYNLVMYGDIVLNDLARLAWVLQALATIAWAPALLAGAGWQRATGVVGLLSGGLVLAAVVEAGAMMTMQALLSIILAQAVWNLAAAVLLVRAKVEARGVPMEAALAT